MFARPVKLGGRGITRKEKKGEQSWGPSYLWCLSFFWLCRVCQCAGGASERASRARPRMREMFFLWEGQPKDPEGPRDFQYASWCVFSWQRRWLGVCVPTAHDLCSLKCGTSRMGTTRKWQTCWCKKLGWLLYYISTKFPMDSRVESQDNSFTWHYFFHEAKLTHLSIGTFWSD